MNCLLEAAASIWLNVRRSRLFFSFTACLPDPSKKNRRVVTEPPEEEVMTAHEGLEQCRRNMEGRERELLSLVGRLSEEAVAKKRAGDVLSARSKLLERRRVQKRLDRLRHGLDLVDAQLDAIKVSELDKEIMLTLKASTSAMRKAGITVGVQEVENVMSEMDEQMREVQDITDVLANPSIGNSHGSLMLLEDADLDAELDDLMMMDSAPPTVITALLPSSPQLPAGRVVDEEPARPAAAAAFVPVVMLNNQALPMGSV